MIVVSLQHECKTFAHCYFLYFEGKYEPEDRPNRDRDGDGSPDGQFGRGRGRFGRRGSGDDDIPRMRFNRGRFGRG